MNADEYALRICEELGGRYIGNKVRCKCPAHEDNDPSLCVSVSEKGLLLVHCFAGCQQSEVIDALKCMGLWPQRRRRNRNRHYIRKVSLRNLTYKEALNVAYGFLPNGRLDESILIELEEMRIELEGHKCMFTEEYWMSVQDSWVDKQVEEMLQQDLFFREFGLEHSIWSVSQCA